MIDQTLLARVKRALPMLQSAPPLILHEFQQAVVFKRLAQGQDVFTQGQHVDQIALLLSGSVRVYQIGETGREITLYRFGMGEACVLTANAILSQQMFPAIATVEEDAEAVIISADVLRVWIMQHELWQTFIFGLLAHRLASVLSIVDEVVFRRMDARIAAFILAKAQETNRVYTTHQQIAVELGSTREVISRILEAFADEHIILIERGLIQVTDYAGLRVRAAR